MELASEIIGSQTKKLKRQRVIIILLIAALVGSLIGNALQYRCRKHEQTAFVCCDKITLRKPMKRFQKDAY